MAAGSPNYDRLSASTLETYRRQFAVQTFDNAALLAVLRQRARIKVKGGRNLVVPLTYEEGTANGGSFLGLDAFSIEEMGGKSAARFGWAFFAEPIAHAWTDTIVNDGDAQVIDLVQADLEQANSTMTDRVNTQLYGDGTGNDGKDLVGLDAMIPVDNTNTYGTIDGSDDDNDWWRNYVTDVSVGGTKTAYDEDVEYNGRPHLLTTMNQAMNNVVARRPSFARSCVWMANMEGYDIYESLADERQRLVDTKVASLGFPTLVHKGCPVMQDANFVTPTGADGDEEDLGHMYLLPTKVILLGIHPRGNFKPTAAVDLGPAGIIGSIRFILVAMQLGCSERRLCAVLYDIRRALAA